MQCSAVRCSAVLSGSPDLLLEEVDIGPHVLDYRQQEVEGALLPLRASVYNKILRHTTHNIHTDIVTTRQNRPSGRFSEN